MTPMMCKQEGVNEPCSMPQGVTDILTLVFMRSFLKKVTIIADEMWAGRSSTLLCDDRPRSVHYRPTQTFSWCTSRITLAICNKTTWENVQKCRTQIWSCRLSHCCFCSVKGNTCCVTYISSGTFLYCGCGPVGECLLPQMVVCNIEWSF